MKNKICNLLLLIFLGILALSILLTVIKEKYEISVALAGIFSAIFIPFFTKDLELEKHKQKLLIQQKQSVYSNLVELFVKLQLKLAKLLINCMLILDIEVSTEHKKNYLTRQIKNNLIELNELFNYIRTTSSICWLFSEGEELKKEIEWNNLETEIIQLVNKYLQSYDNEKLKKIEIKTNNMITFISGKIEYFRKEYYF